jgi:hypothetical protein
MVRAETRRRGAIAAGAEEGFHAKARRREGGKRGGTASRLDAAGICLGLPYMLDINPIGSYSIECTVTVITHDLLDDQQ